MRNLHKPVTKPEKVASRGLSRCTARLGKAICAGRDQREVDRARHRTAPRWRTRLGMLLFTCCIAAVAQLTACGTGQRPAPIAELSFSAYQREAVSRVATERAFQTSDIQNELAWNTPSEWRPASMPATRAHKGILLVHGLGDSPWSFHDLAPRLAGEGFLVRTVLLPGHGTHPKHLLDVTVDEWRRVVRQQATALEKDVDGPVFLGGFSTGANLVLELAYERSEVAGLLLFSPGFRSTVPFGWIAQLAAPLMPWIIAPDETDRVQNAVRYMVTPTNGFAQFHVSATSAQRLLRSAPYTKPVFMVVAEHDSVLDSTFLLQTFERRFTHPASRLIWYGATPATRDPTRVLVRTDRIASEKISQFSHMGILFSSSNPLYGTEGLLRICLNSMDASLTRACEQGVDLWYSDWGYKEKGKVHARLTFNPYFEWQSSVMVDVLAASSHLARSGE